MLFQKDLKFITKNSGNMVFKFLETGDIFEILCGNIMVNMFNGTYKEGSLNNIYLRIYKNNEVKIIPVLGIKSKSEIAISEKSILFAGKEEEIEYKVKFTLCNNNIWIYTIDILGENLEMDILYCQDVAIANKAAVLSNELYTSQYIDHVAIEKNGSYVLCSRQNQDQNGKFPYLEQGFLNLKAVSYATDGMDFFTKEYKESNEAYFINKNLPKEKYQFECSYISMQSEKFILNGRKKVYIYGLFKEDYREAISELKYSQDILNELKFIDSLDEDFEKINKIKLKSEFGNILVSEDFTEEEIDNIYKYKNFKEYNGEKLLSFFTNNHSHVVLKNKEILCERPHGNIIISGINKEKISLNVFSSTNYMYGIFNSQVVLGNTNLNKLISVNRGLLNIFKNTGQRIYIKINNEFRLLTLPYIYEMGLNFSKWYYKVQDDVIVIKVYSYFNHPKVTLELESLNNKEYQFIITNQIVMGENEFSNNFYVYRNENKVKILPEEGSFLKNTYKDIYYEFELSEKDFYLGNDEVFYCDEVRRDSSLLTFKLNKTSKFNLSIFGSFENVEIVCKRDFENERNKFNEFYEDLLNGFKIEKVNFKYNLDKLNEIIYFYAHNALIHFASPHGLEQSGGAAWGTRDVCQGPVEFFLSTNNYKLVREILLIVYSKQFKENGEWPQWFMYDKYNMQQGDSHGDVIFWPIKALSEYITITGDKGILYEKVSYKSIKDFSETKEEEIINHIKLAINSIKNRFINNTYLISYEGGDWDDTLQPVSDNLKQKLVSTWTMCLAYETIKKLYNVIEEESFKEELKEIYEGIQKDFLKLAIKQKVIGGFIYVDKEIQYIIHPLDEKTKIKYRLLPLIRSVISEIVDLNQAKINENIIEENLTFKDGIRLMNMTPKYKGGVSEIFKRAEQSSNVGREISLQYVHAHIRYIEAMCFLGEENKVWDALFKINPINIKESVENADYRQSNCYFSSSDGDFKSRYDFQNNFNKLKTGEVKVKGGWRIYSSGPGIYINKLITRVLGIRIKHNKIIFDPIIPKELNKLCFSYKILNKKIKIIYKFNDNICEKNIILNGEKLPFNLESNNYRSNFKSVNIEIFENKLKEINNLLEIEI